MRGQGGQRKHSFEQLFPLAPLSLAPLSLCNGLEFSGHLFAAKSASATERPLCVNDYSCRGFARGGVGDEWPLASLAESGISTLCLNAPPPQADPFARYDGGVFAVVTAVDLLTAEGRIDTGRVGMGGSASIAKSYSGSRCSRILPQPYVSPHHRRARFTIC